MNKKLDTIHFYGLQITNYKLKTKTMKTSIGGSFVKLKNE